MIEDTSAGNSRYRKFVALIAGFSFLLGAWSMILLVGIFGQYSWYTRTEYQDVAWSPDGKLIEFEVDLPAKAFYQIQSDGTNFREIKSQILDYQCFDEDAIHNFNQYGKTKILNCSPSRDKFLLITKTQKKLLGIEIPTETLYILDGETGGVIKHLKREELLHSLMMPLSIVSLKTSHYVLASLILILCGSCTLIYLPRKKSNRLAIFVALVAALISFYGWAVIFNILLWTSYFR